MIMPTNYLLVSKFSTSETAMDIDSDESLSCPEPDDSGERTPSLPGSMATPELPPSDNDEYFYWTDDETPSLPDIELQVPKPEEIKKWLSTLNRNAASVAKQILGVEFYSVPRVLQSVHQEPCLSFDVLNGWDFDMPVCKKLSLDILRRCDVNFLCLSPPCTMFSELQRAFNFHKMPVEVYERRMKQARGYVAHSMDGARIQIRKKKKFMYEHPWRASSWKLTEVEQVVGMKGVRLCTFDQCQLGLLSPAGMPVKKRTTIVTNDLVLAEQLQSKQCPRDHIHRPIEGSENRFSMSKFCQTYPPGLVQLLAEAVQRV